MGSTFMVKIRTAAMMICLVAAPLWALLGSDSAPGRLLSRLWAGAVETARLGDPASPRDGDQLALRDDAPLRVTPGAVHGRTSADALRSPAADSVHAGVRPAGFERQRKERATLTGGSQELNGRRATGSSSPAPWSVDPWAALEERMNALGVRYYVLERLPKQADGFRFHCRVDDPRRGGAVVSFDARAAEPSQAIASVTRQIEQWISSGR